MDVFNNTKKIAKDDLVKAITTGSKITITTSCFSIYVYQELKKQLSYIDSHRFIFTSPTFVVEKTPMGKHEFYVPRLSREKSLYGTEFEVKLRNELTQKTIAKECAAWIINKEKIKSNLTHEEMIGFLDVENSEDQFTYTPINVFTTVDLGCERGNNVYNMINIFEFPFSKEYIRLFGSLWNNDVKLQDVTEYVIDSISAVFQENPAELIYYMTLFIIFTEFLDDVSDDVLPNEATDFKDRIIWKKLYNFQRDVALVIIYILEQYNGCLRKKSDDNRSSKFSKLMNRFVRVRLPIINSQIGIKGVDQGYGCVYKQLEYCRETCRCTDVLGA